MQPAIFRNQLLAKLSAKQAAEKNKQTNQNNKTVQAGQRTHFNKPAENESRSTSRKGR